MDQVYRSVSVVPITHPQDKYMLLPETKMPSNITGIKYASASGQLALFGDSLYLFNLKPRTLKTVTTLPSYSYSHTVYNWQTDHLCLLNSYADNDTLLVNLIDGTTQADAPDCSPPPDISTDHQSQRAQKEQDIQALIKRLDLPANYQITAGAR